MPKFAIAACRTGRSGSSAGPPAAVVKWQQHAHGLGLFAHRVCLGARKQGLDFVMLHDKKMDAGTLPFVLLRGIGEAYLARDVALADVAVFLDGELRR